MAHTPTTKALEAKGKGAATEEKAAARLRQGGSEKESPVEVLNARTQAKFVLFNIPKAERVKDGPVMRGFVEIAGEGEKAEPVKVNVAGWPKIARDTGTEYLSLKVANTEGGDREGYTVGPFYGRLFKDSSKTRSGEKVRYFGFIEDAEKVGEGKDGQGVYTRHWQLAVRARRAVSRDGKTVYLSGSVGPAQEAAADGSDIAF